MIRTLATGIAAGALAVQTLAQTPLPQPGPARWIVEARLVDFECGDNCWLGYRDSKGRRETALCAASRCAAWMQAARLPKALVGKRVRLGLRMGKATSGDVVMAEAQEVFEMAFVE